MAATDRTPEPSFTDRVGASFDRFIERWGNLAALAFGAAVLFIGLGSTGLWEPWEMARVELARTLASPPEAVVALAPGEDATADIVNGAAQSAGVIIRKPYEGGGEKNEAQSALGATLDAARSRIVSTVVLDLKLLLPNGVGDSAAWPTAAQRISEAVRATAGGTVVLLNRDSDEATLRQRLALERWRATWQSIAGSYHLDTLADGPTVERALATAAANEPDDEVVHIVGPSDSAGFQRAFEAGASAIDGRVAYKEKGGETVAAPPLQTWLRAASYRVLGTSEASTRLPGALLALVTLWVLLATARTLWGPRVAFMAGLVLATLPLFYGQGRIAQGDAALMLALTLVACSQLLATHKDVPKALPWTYLATGLVLGVLGSGVFAAIMFAVLLLAVPVVMGSKSLDDWLPAIGVSVVAFILYMLTRDPEPGSFMAQLGFQVPLFESTTTETTRTFDLLISQLGFGMNPWSPFVVVAVGSLAWWSLEAHDRRGLVVALWFFVPFVAVVATYKVGNHFLFAGPAAAALASALFMQRVIERGVPARFIALALVLMYVVLRHDLKDTPGSMVSWITWEQPFTKDGVNRFPETLKVGSEVRWALLFAGLFCLGHFGRIFAALSKALEFMGGVRPTLPSQTPADTTAKSPRRDKPFVIAVATLLVLASVMALFFIARMHGPFMGRSFKETIGDSERAFVSNLSSFGDPIFMVSILTIVVLLLAAILSFGFKLPLSPPPLLRRFGLSAAAVIWALLAIVLVIFSPAPAGYWGETLTSLPSLIGFAGALGFGALVYWLADDKRDKVLQGASGVVAVLAFLLVTRLIRDANWYGEGVVALAVFAGYVGAALTLLPRLLASAQRFAIGGAVLAVIFAVGFIVPLADRWSWLRELSAEGAATVTVEPLGGEILSSLVVALAIVGAVLVLAAFRWIALRPNIGDDVVVGIRLFAGWLERRSTFVVVMMLCALVVTASALFRFGPAFAVNVSQKHIIDTWLESEQGEDKMARMFKLPMGGGARRGSSYYTDDVPEIRDRQVAMQVLRGTEDQIVTVETELMSESRIITGWDYGNDKNRDDKRDEPAIRGFATAVSGATLTDSTKSWTPHSLKGKRLVNLAGQTWTIVDNDATSVTVDDASRLAIHPSPPRSAYYAIDGATTANPRATGDAPVRRALLIPADNLSEINYQWRKVSGGPHLPILDGSSYRVLLAASALTPGQENQNRLAASTFDDKSYAALRDSKLKRVWGNFDDTIQVVGYSLESASVSTGQSLNLSVYYKALKPIQKNYKIFVHLDRVGGGGQRVGGDHWPLNPTKHTEENKNCTGCFRTDHWLPGDIVKDTYAIEIPETSGGEHIIYVGFFEPGPDKRLAVKDFDKKNVKHDGTNRLGIGTFMIR